MDRLFSATDEKDEELTAQVASDIEKAKQFGEVDTDEVNYKDMGDGKVAITDKGNGEITIAEKDENDGNYDLYVYEGEGTPAEMDNQIEGYLHPEGNGVTKGDQVGAPDEHVEDHMDGEGVSDFEKITVEENAENGCCSDDECDSREFSVSSDNEVVNRIFQDQIYHERLFSDVLNGEEDTAIVGNLEIQKVDDEDNTLIVRDRVSNDLARVTLDDENMEVEELEGKNFGECEYGYDDPEQFNAYHIIGVDAGNHNIIDTSEYDPEEAQEVAARLSEEGVDAVEIFDNPQDARDYAISLLESLGVRDLQDVDEPEEATFSDHTIYVTRYYSDHTYFMDKMFSEAVNDIEVSQGKIEDAISSGDEIETDDEIVTPIDANTAIVEDKENNEFTKVTLDGEDMQLDPISGSEAANLMEDLAIEDTDEDLDEKDYSEVDFDEDERYYSDYDYEGPEVYCDESEMKYFSGDEEMTEYMVRLFSDEADSDVEDIADAIESGEEIEVDGEIITPVDSNSAIIEDKINHEFTRAVMDIDGTVEVNPMPSEIAVDVLEDVDIEDVDDDLDEKEYSEGEIYCDETETKFFSEDEEMTEYMSKLFSGEADSNEEDIADAIESGEEIEVDGEIITPVDANTAIIEDKENNEFTKATLGEDGDVEVSPMPAEDAKSMLEDVAVEDTDEDLEKNYSYYEDPVLDKFFTDAVGMPAGQGEPEVIPAVVDPATGQLVPAEQMQQEAQQPQLSVEAIEDKALAAIQSIQAVAAEGEAQILNAKAAPSQEQMQNLQEAQFSDTEDNTEDEKFFSETEDTLVSWLTGIK
jgi:hypothetical protein